jgi:DNA-binding response OmpR family regulator
MNNNTPTPGSTSQNAKDFKMYPPKPRVLLIDDDRDLRETLTDGMEAAGYEVIQADNVQDIMKRLSMLKVSIIIVDLVLIGNPGSTLLSYVKSHPSFKSIKVIMMSGFEHGESTARLWGADQFLPKPVSIAQLIATLNRLSAPISGVAHGLTQR